MVAVCYNVIAVVEHNGNYIVADGNHRLKVLLELGIEEVPCLIRTGDPYKVAVECNADEDTYAPMDLFDWLSVLGNLKRQGLKGVEVADKLGWSPQKVSDYSNVLEKISAQVLEMARCCQIGRADKKSAMADFTEFFPSHIYKLRNSTFFVHPTKNYFSQNLHHGLFCSVAAACCSGAGSWGGIL